MLQCCECQSGEKQARVNGESNHDNVISVQCFECQSGEKTGAGKRQEPNVSTSVDVAVWFECTMNTVSNGDHSTFLSFVSCGASQGYAPQGGDLAKLWFQDFHAYQARVHGKSLAHNIRRAKHLVPELFGPVETEEQKGRGKEREATGTDESVCPHVQTNRRIWSASSYELQTDAEQGSCGGVVM